MSFWTDLQGTEFAQRWIDAGGVRTRIVEAGRGERAVLLLHGVQGHLEVWLKNIAALAAQHRVVAMDMLGHGFTARPNRPYEISDYIAHALATLDALGIKRATWIGSSLGGWVSARAAALHPGRVEKLVLVSTAGLTADPAVMAKLKSLGEKAASMPGPEGVRERLKFVIHDPADVTEELVQSRWNIYSRPDYRAALKHINILQDMQTRERNLLRPEELGSIRAPTLVVWTDHDPTASLDTGRQYQRLIPGAKFVIIPDCSHIPSLERPEEFNRVVLDFLGGGT
ncbi:MAG TPA: alpha/beta fold hydrolase [Burkholderiales bacterium]|nr:alpha/beta fold hydrolase [Burkholderiales bacterium]